MRKGAEADAALEGMHDKVQELNDHILPPGVKIVPFLDRSDLVHFTTHTVLHNLTEGIVLVSIILFLFLGNVRGAIIVALTIPFSLLFAATCLKLERNSSQLAFPGRVGFRNGGGWHRGHGGEHRAPPQRSEGQDIRTPKQKIFDAAHEVQRPVFYAMPFYHHGLPSDLHAATRGRTFVQTHGLDGGVCAARSHPVFDDGGAGSGQPRFFRKGTREWHNPVMAWLTRGYRRAVRSAIRWRYVTVAVGHGGMGLALRSWLGPADRLRVSAAPG